jgi:RNA polymerase sigma-70 factor (ECF subfamily)
MLLIVLLCATGDLAALRSLLADDAVAMADSAGEVPTAGRRPVEGPDRVARLYASLTGKVPPDLESAPAWINGHPGVVWRQQGRVWGVTTFEVRGDRIVSVLSVLASGKLTHLR